jgi:hypothetical protein
MVKWRIVVAAFAALACSAEDPPKEEPGTVTWCQALAVLEASCQRCHGSPLQNSAPFALLTYADTQPLYGRTEKKEMWRWMRQWIATDFMPPVNASTMMLDPPVQALTCDQKTTLMRWLDEGAKPTGGLDCTPADKTLLACDPALGGTAGTSGM